MLEYLDRVADQMDASGKSKGKGGKDKGKGRGWQWHTGGKGNGGGDVLHDPAAEGKTSLLAQIVCPPDDADEAFAWLEGWLSTMYDLDDRTRRQVELRIWKCIHPDKGHPHGLALAKHFTPAKKTL